MTSGLGRDVSDPTAGREGRDKDPLRRRRATPSERPSPYHRDMPSFAALTPVPADPILGLTELFVADPRAEKVSLASGVYVDETGKTPILEVVREAEGRILLAQTTKVYKPIAGDPAYTRPRPRPRLRRRPPGRRRRGASRRSTLRAAPARCASRRTSPTGSVPTPPSG